jgi:quercetin dioxygenase-like cupin family protein
MAQDRIADTTAHGIARPPDRRIDFDLEAFRWAGIEEQAYKFTLGDERGMGWKGVTRHTLASPAALPAAFELRYFELQPGGYSSLEKHRHVHFVIAVRGSGRALIDEDVLDVSPFDALYVASLTPHRWLNEGHQPFGFLCTVDGERDQPVPLDDAEWERLRSNRVTAPYVF